MLIDEDSLGQVKFVHLFKITTHIKFACDYDEAKDYGDTAFRSDEHKTTKQKKD